MRPSSSSTQVLAIPAIISYAIRTWPTQTISSLPGVNTSKSRKNLETCTDLPLALIRQSTAKSISTTCRKLQRKTSFLWYPRALTCYCTFKIRSKFFNFLTIIQFLQQYRFCRMIPAAVLFLMGQANCPRISFVSWLLRRSGVIAVLAGIIRIRTFASLCRCVFEKRTHRFKQSKHIFHFNAFSFVVHCNVLI